MKSVFLDNLIKSQNDENRTNGNEIKAVGSINFSDIVEYIKGGISNEEYANICADIKSGKVKIGMDANAVDTLLASKDNDKVRALFQDVKLPKMDIDVTDLTDLSSDKFNQIKAMGINVGRVYVNSGFDEAAARGYTPDVYSKIVTTAEAMVKKAKSDAVKKNPGKKFEDLSERDRFMAIYDMVIDKANFNYAAVTANDEQIYTSRNLQDFFCKNGSAVCAGFAGSLVQLGKMCGLEMEYVQGDSKSKKMNKKEYHAWVRVKIDGKWLNADPTWDSKKIYGKYGCCLKEDAEFEGHVIDNGYNPTYRRGENGRLLDGRRYDYSDYEGPVGKNHITDEQTEYLNSNYIPNAPSSAGTLAGKNIITIILNFLIRITSLPSKAASRLKEKFYAGKLDSKKLASSEANKYIEEEAKKEGAFDDIHVDEKQAQSYKNKPSKAKEDKAPETDQERG